MQAKKTSAKRSAAAHSRATVTEPRSGDERAAKLAAVVEWRNAIARRDEAGMRRVLDGPFGAWLASKLRAFVAAYLEAKRAEIESKQAEIEAERAEIEAERLRREGDGLRIALKQLRNLVETLEILGDEAIAEGVASTASLRNAIDRALDRGDLRAAQKRVEDRTLALWFGGIEPLSRILARLESTIHTTESDVRAAAVGDLASVLANLPADEGEVVEAIRRAADSKERSLNGPKAGARVALADLAGVSPRTMYRGRTRKRP